MRFNPRLDRVNGKTCCKSCEGDGGKEVRGGQIFDQGYSLATLEDQKPKKRLIIHPSDILTKRSWTLSGLALRHILTIKIEA